MDEWGNKKHPSPLSEICHTYRKMMKLGAVMLYLKKIEKMYESRNTLLVLLTSAFFDQKSANFAILKNTDIDYIFIHNF